MKLVKLWNGMEMEFGMSKVFGNGNGNGIGVWNRMHVAGKARNLEMNGLRYLACGHWIRAIHYHVIYQDIHCVTHHYTINHVL